MVILQKINNKLNKVGPAIVEGRFLNKLDIFIKVYSGKISKSADRTIGLFGKWILSKTTIVNPKKIMFITFQGDYTCNPKYITEKILEEKIDCEIVWTSRKYNLNKNDIFPPNVKIVEQYTFDFYKELASSKIWIANSVEFLKSPLPKKRNQYLIETWHGSLGIKRFGKNENSGIRWVKAAELNGKIANYCISNSVFETKVLKETFWPNTPILEFGHPRNDIFFDGYYEKRNQLKEKICSIYGINPDKKILLYAPTFRDSHTFSCYNLDFEKVRSALMERFGGEWEILVRFHPTVRKERKKMRIKNKVIDVTIYPDIQEIMAISDVAITDYSSWIYDFVLTQRPGFIFAVDIEKYNTERGFYYPLETTPFPIAVDNDELINNIMQFDTDLYEKKVINFLNDKICFEDGHASERVAKVIKDLIE